MNKYYPASKSLLCNSFFFPLTFNPVIKSEISLNIQNIASTRLIRLRPVNKPIVPPREIGNFVNIKWITHIRTLDINKVKAREIT